MKNASEIENEHLAESVNPDSDLKVLIVEYVGTKHEPKNNEVTVEMVIDTFASEFPEFVLALAEENFFRGYEQGLQDIAGPGPQDIFAQD
tara:strand:+ start:110 stop:379 length:270 start_codon:yes stop_codon:yes gene_type:complete